MQILYLKQQKQESLLNPTTCVQPLSHFSAILLQQNSKTLMVSNSSPPYSLSTPCPSGIASPPFQPNCIKMTQDLHFARAHAITSSYKTQQQHWAQPTTLSPGPGSYFSAASRSVLAGTSSSLSDFKQGAQSYLRPSLFFCFSSLSLLISFTPPS